MTLNSVVLWKTSECGSQSIRLDLVHSLTWNYTVNSKYCERAKARWFGVENEQINTQTTGQALENPRGAAQPMGG